LPIPASNATLIHTTKKLADKLKIMPPEPPEQFDEMLSWRANYVHESGASFVIFMNEAPPKG
jgi:hypothetical protein